MRAWWASGLVLVLALGFAHPVHADPAMDVAIRADAVNREHCGRLYKSSGGQPAQAVSRADEAAHRQAVLDVFLEVEQYYGQTAAPYLLFWRGALGQCLGATDSAREDLTAFVDSQEGSPMFGSLVRQAKVRLRRLGLVKGTSDGPAARFLRRDAPLELEVAYAAGSGLHVLGCTDFDYRDQVVGGGGAGQEGGEASRSTQALHLNQVCRGSYKPTDLYGAAASPLGLDLSARGFFLPWLGMGGRVLLDHALGSGLPDKRSPGLTTQLLVGPWFRVANAASSGGRAARLQVGVNLALAWGRISPWAGGQNPCVDEGGEGCSFLDAGSYDLRHMGPSLALAGAFESGPGSFVELAGLAAVYVPTGADGSPQVIEASRQVAILPSVVAASRFSAGIRLGVMKVAPQGTLALGPFLDLRLHRATIELPNDSSDCWWVDNDEATPEQGVIAGCSGSGTNLELSKVYSTVREDLLIRFGLSVRFGVRKKVEGPQKEMVVTPID